MINHIGCIEDESEHRRSTSKTSGNGLHARGVLKGIFRTFRITRLRNRHAHVDEEVLDPFNRKVEVDVASNRFKVHDSYQRLI